MYYCSRSTPLGQEARSPGYSLPGLRSSPGFVSRDLWVFCVFRGSGAHWAHFDLVHWPWSRSWFWGACDQGRESSQLPQWSWLGRSRSVEGLQVAIQPLLQLSAASQVSQGWVRPSGCRAHAPRVLTPESRAWGGCGRSWKAAQPGPMKHPATF